MSNELTVVQRAAIALGAAEHEKALIALADNSKSIVAITNPASYQQCHSARMALKNARVALNKTGKGAREDAQAFSTAVIAEEKRLIAIIEPEESRLQSIQDAHDAKVEAEKQARIEAERARVDALRSKIASLVAFPAQAARKGAEEISGLIFYLESIEIGPDYQEFEGDAISAKEESLNQLREMRRVQSDFEAAEAARLKAQAEEAGRLAAERAELAKLRAEQAERDRIAQAELEAQRAEQRRIEREAKAKRDQEEAEARAKRAEEDRIAREKRDAEEAAAKAVRDEADRIAREAREAEEAAMAEQRAEIARQRAVIDAETQRLERIDAEKKAAAEAMAEQQPAILPSFRPTDWQIIEVVADAFDVTADVALEWIGDFNLAAAYKELEVTA